MKKLRHDIDFFKFNNNMYTKFVKCGFNTLKFLSEKFIFQGSKSVKSTDEIYVDWLLRSVFF